jgi:hypothetical protein
MFGGSEKCRCVRKQGEKRRNEKVVKKRRGKKEIVNERTGNSWRASE